jgi:hypothetical protein
VLSAEHYNLILDPLLVTFERRVPSISPLSIAAPELFQATGTYGPVIAGCHFAGALKGKVTLITTWDTATELFKASGSNQDASADAAAEFIEFSFRDALDIAEETLEKKGLSIETTFLPSLCDCHVLVWEISCVTPIIIRVFTPWQSMDLFIALSAEDATHVSPA